ncbi:hypothetical protein SLEP1_g14792 [Rubroshorea leprosula]|uniref:Uncharacterized protein n=1 Tax=Rubroshorea leprosula TaxID=152421 RepID=A0AAV5IR51_9ROSI|nr:hypothetical protein SLEP1_g14792 [Rubroshorea leprosula]
MPQKVGFQVHKHYLLASTQCKPYNASPGKGWKY